MVLSEQFCFALRNKPRNSALIVSSVETVVSQGSQFKNILMLMNELVFPRSTTGGRHL